MLGPRFGLSSRTSASLRSPSIASNRRSISASRSERPLIASATGSGRWIQSASGPSGLRPSTRTVWPGLPTTVRVRRDVGDHDRVRADLGAVADPDRAEQLGARADRHVVFDRRVALPALEAGAAQRDPLVDGHAGADLGGLADHHARAVVDEELLADPRRRVDLDPRDGARRVGERGGSERHPGLVQRVGQAMGEDRLDPAPRGEDLERAGVAGRGVAVTCGGDVGAELLEHARQAVEAEHGTGA